MPIHDPTNNNPDVEVVKKKIKKHDPDWQPKEAGYGTGGPVDAGKEPKKATEKQLPFQGEQY